MTPRLLALGLAATLLPASAPSVARLGWMAGCWRMESGDRVVEEQWMAPRAGLMLGMSRTTVADTVREHEHVLIREENGRLLFRAAPSGQAPADFLSIEQTATSVVFENPRHDFPQRVAYESAAGGDSLLARVEGRIGDRERVVRFPYARAACGAA